PRAPCPASPWHDAQYVANTSPPRRASPADGSEYGGRSIAPTALGFVQCVRRPLTMASICSSVSIPPERLANAGIGVPATPSAVARRITTSSATARYIGSASGVAAPPRPSGPWQPAQFVRYRALKSTILSGATFSAWIARRPGALSHPAR